MVQKFDWQETPHRLTAIVDTDYAGYLETRKSTSGRVLMHGSHCVRTWSTTQYVIALSSGEAELYGIVKGASAAMGFQSVAADLGVKLDIDFFSDSAAARGMVRRTGLGKVRHIQVQELWFQQALREGRFALNPIIGVDNPASILTEYVDKSGLDKHCKTLGLVPRMGRSGVAPRVFAPVSPTGPLATVGEEECENMSPCNAILRYRLTNGTIPTRSRYHLANGTSPTESGIHVPSY